MWKLGRSTFHRQVLIECQGSKSRLHILEEYPSPEPDAVLESSQEVFVGELDHVDAIDGEARVLAHVLDVAICLALSRQ